MEFGMTEGMAGWARQDRAVGAIGQDGIGIGRIS